MFIFVGTTALVVLTVVAITGGFVIDVGLLHFSAHRVTVPLIVAVLAYAAAAVTGRDAFLAAASAVPAFLARHAASLAVILAAAAAGIGIGDGTHAASGADASGYINQAELLTHGQLTVSTPLASRVSWPEAEWSFAPLGFRPGQHAGEIVPTYPPGLPIVMALGLTFGGETAPFLVVPLLGALTVLCTYWLGTRLAFWHRPVRPASARFSRATAVRRGGSQSEPPVSTALSGRVATRLGEGGKGQPSGDRPYEEQQRDEDRPRDGARMAGVVAAALMATSPVFLFQIVQPMSDVPAAAWWTLALLAAASGRPIGAGMASALAVLTRPSLMPLAAAVAAVLTIWSDAGPRSARVWAARLIPFGAALSSGIGALALIQWRLYGHPLASGHGTFAELFAAQNILPNIRDYSMRVIAGEAPAIALTAGAVLLMAMARGVAWRLHGPKAALDEQASPVAVMKALRLTILVALLVLLCYLPYGVFPDWSYLRFLLPVFPLAFMTVAALLVSATARLPAAIRGPVLVVAITAACSANVLIASRESAFNLRFYEARYRTVGRYLDAALPKEAVIVTSQESGSLHHYTSRPILRWDLLAADLDAAVDVLTTLGRHPVLLVEDWEEPELRRRFPSSTLAKADWSARARFGTTTRVRLLDPADRGRPRAWPADYIP